PIVPNVVTTSRCTNIRRAAARDRSRPGKLLAVTYLSQNWSAADRDVFYTTSQGSPIMPFAWFQGLKHADGQPLLADGLARYGYLANPRSSTPPQGLPVGFTLDIRAGQPYVDMTCAACHTRQIEVGGQFYRIDGGPAIVDFEALLRDVQSAVRNVLTDTDTSPAFDAFSQTVLGSGNTPQARTALRLEVTQQFAGYDTILRGALPQKDWGLARIDAVGMIFNRVAGLDLDLPAISGLRMPRFGTRSCGMPRARIRHNGRALPRMALTCWRWAG